MLFDPASLVINILGLSVLCRFGSPWWVRLITAAVLSARTFKRFNIWDSDAAFPTNFSYGSETGVCFQVEQQVALLLLAGDASTGFHSRFF